jgi:ketopantoate reductase
MDKSSSTRDVAIVGAGALGRWIAARLASGGIDVSLVTRPGTNAGTTSCHIIEERVSGEEDSQPLPLQEINSGPATAFCNEKFRWLLLCTKARDLAAAVRETKGLLAVDGCVAVLSNGLGHGETLRTFGIERCVAATVTYGLLAAEDGSVHRCGDGG